MMDPSARFAVALTVLIFAVAIGLFSTVVMARRIRRGRGASGIHGVATPFYLLAMVLTLEPVLLRGEPFWLFKILEVALVFGFHLFQMFLLPNLLRKWWEPGRQIRERTDDA